MEHGDEVQDNTNCTVVHSEDGSLTYKPSCGAGRTPREGQIFQSLNHGISFYQNYGKLGGFDTRRYSEKKLKGGTIQIKYMVCSKEGEIRVKEDEPKSSTTKKRKRLLTRTNCEAMIRFSLLPDTGGYRVSKFIKEHNHPLVGKTQLHQLRGNRHMGEGHVAWLSHCKRSGIGPSDAHRLMGEQCGGVENVGALKRDFMNYQRDLKAYIADSDVQIILDEFRAKKNVDKSFYYDYDEDTTGRLTKLFWCDGISVKNYELYGDCVTFDTTYRTNMYSMPICPFTGVDNYKKSVTFGLGLVTREDTESFTWMFKAFLKAMNNKQPPYFITDQDPAMKIAVPNIMPDSRHKFCMWHIMDKLSSKVPATLMRDTDFREKIHALSYNNNITPEVFERRWAELLKEFDMEDHTWLTNIYELRQQWIPAYYRDLPMGQFMRTTSRSESTNAAFQKYTDRYLGLVHLIWGCNSVIDNQRQVHYRLMMQSYTSLPRYRTLAGLEADAWGLYTRPIYDDVQTDIKDAMDFCRLKDMGGDGVTKIYIIVDTKYITDGKEYHVCHTLSTDHFKCGCNKLLSSGMICPHIFFVLQTAGFKKIPRALVYSRWCKDTDMINKMSDNGAISDEMEVEDINLMTALKERFDEILEMPNVAYTSIRELLNIVQTYKVKTVDEEVEEARMNRTSYIANVTGITLPDIVAVHPPEITNTKGGRLQENERMQRERDRAIAQSQKPKRMCKTCMTMTNKHDSRNCPLKNKSKR